jgi:hypothetical protein
MKAYFHMVVNLIPTTLNSDGCTIFLKDEKADAWVLRYASKGNPLESDVGIASYNVGEGLTGWVLLKGKSLRINDIEDKEELRRIDPKLQWVGKHLEFMKHHSNFLAAPIKAGREVYGVIRLSKGTDGTPFTEEDERLLSKYGKSLGSAMRSLKFEQDEAMLVRPNYEGRYVEGNDCCYVLMPYTKDWSLNVRRTIKNAVVSNGLRFCIADEQKGQHIMGDVWRGLCESKIIIADLSGANPNVTYEVGLADVLGKQIILLAQNTTDIPFDFTGKRLLTYHLDRIYDLQDELTKRIGELAGETNRPN